MKPTPTPIPNPIHCFVNLIGQRFGSLEVIDYGGQYHGKSAWVCRCDCGAVCQTLGGNMKAGRTVSCGCRRNESIAAKKTRHGHTKGYKPSPEYKAWAGMKRRCLQASGPDYPDYGGRGITIHPEWVDSFEAFLRDVGAKPRGRYSLGRKKNDGNYEPGNVIWETPQQQSRNRRNVVLYEFNGEKRCVTEWEGVLGIPAAVLRRRIKRGWSVQRAFTTPAQKQSFY